MSKTRNQRKRDREEFILMMAVASWLLCMVVVILYKAVTG